MSILFLQDLSIFAGNETGGDFTGLVSDSFLTSILSGLVETFEWIFIAFVLIIFVLYLYISAAYLKIGSKARLSNSGIAWMPVSGPIAIIFEASKMHWWPFLVLVIGILLSNVLAIFILSNPLIISVVSLVILIVSILIFTIMAIGWHWRTYDEVGKPGWWILVPIFSLIAGAVLELVGLGKSSMLTYIGMIILSLGLLSHLIFIGVAAWSESPGLTNYEQTPTQIS